MLFTDFLTILYAWAATFIFQLVAAPYLIVKYRQKLIDGGWALARPLTWLSIGLIIWVISHFHIPLNTDFGLATLITVLFISSLIFLKRNKKIITNFIHSHKRILITQELLFFIGFFSLSIIRMFNPEIRDLEKFMDSGFMASYLRASTLPAPDIWLAGESINYYSFGHFLGSIFTRFWHLDLGYTYNLLLGLIMGLGLMLSFSLVINLLKNSINPKSSTTIIISGLIGSLLTIVGGNTHTIWYWLTNHSFAKYWYADATRFIENTIHEFPSYSFVVSDLHAHVWGLPFVLTFLIFIIVWVQDLFSNLPAINIKKLIKQLHLKQLRKQIRKFIKQPPPHFKSSLILGIILGSFVMTSAWDALIYSIFLTLLGLMIFLSFPRLFFKLLLSAITIISTAALTASLWIINFTSISEGIAIVTQRSPIWQLFALWTDHVTLSLLALLAIFAISVRIKQIPRQATLLIIATMIFTAWTMLVLPEIIYVKDIYSGHPRANTMFKLTYQGFILMSLVGGWLMGVALNKKFLSRYIRLFLLITIVLLTSFNLLFPYFSYRDYYGSLKTIKGLDGYTWLEKQHPDDFKAINWMKQNILGQPHILEAVGESYTTFDRVSAVTGIPTVLGWRVHEWLWRGGFDIPGQRTEEVKTMFEAPLSPEAKRLYDLYQVEFIFVGDKEYETYNINQPDIKSLGEEVFSSGSTYIIHRNHSQ